MPTLFRRLTGTFLAQILAAALLLAACGQGKKEGAREAKLGQAAEAPRRGGTAVVVTTADLGGLNELTTPSTTTSIEVHRQLYLSLLEEQPDFAEHPATFGPRLARSWEWSPDHTVLTLHLREATWSDGVPITAEDVRFTWQAQIHPEVAWDEVYFKRHIKDVEVVDPHTVRVHFDGAYATQLLDLNEGRIMPKHAWGKLPFSQWRQHSEFFAKNLVVSGPFTLEAWRAQEEIVLVRNPRYFEPGLPRLDRVVLRVVPLVTNQVTQLLSGAADFLGQVPSSEVERVESSKRVHLIPYWGRRFVFVAWNNLDPHFDDPEVRRALTLAIDRETLVETLWGERARVATSPIVSSVWAHDRTLRPWPYDPEEARRILAAKGWRDSDGDGVLDRGGRRFAFELVSNQGNAERQAAAEMVQDQLKKVGIEVKVSILEFNTLVERLQSHRFEAAMLGLGMPTTLDLEYAYASTATGDANYGSYSNPEVDRLILEIRRQRELADAAPLLARLQQILHREQPVTYLWESQDLAGVANRIQNAQPNSLAALFKLEEWWVRPGS